MLPVFTMILPMPRISLSFLTVFSLTADITLCLDLIKNKQAQIWEFLSWLKVNQRENQKKEQ
jgi:hypothetical protein